MAESKSKDQQAKKGPRFSQEQYDMLIRCSEKKDMTEWNQWRKENSNENILLEGANLVFAHLEDAFLLGSHLENAKLRCAYLNDANLANAHLEKADLVDTHLEGTNFKNAFLEGADFQIAIVSGSTSFCYCEVDRYTDFRGVGLDSARMDPGTKQLLEYNIRRMNWEDWYKEHWFLRWPVRLFWLISDYGRSTGRVVLTFFVLATAFALVYYFVPGLVNDLHGTGHWYSDLVRACYFSIVTMTTLGFGDMYADKQSIAGHILLSLQVLLGYVLLGALITRFAVLFTAGGPAGKFADEKKESEDDERKHNE